MSLSEIRVNTTKTRTGVGTITYTETGPVITGIATASNFKTGSTNVHSTGVELANINTGGSTATFGGAISGTTASFSGNVSIGGTLTYEDVTNIDSVGILTARAGIKVTGGDILLTGGDGRKISFAGDGSAHYFKMDNSFNGPVINGYAGIKFETYGTNERLRINSAGTVRIKRAVSTSLGNDSIFLAIGDTENGANVNRMIGFGYNSNFGTSVYPASMGYTETDNSGNTKGALTFNTRNTTGATDVPVERLRITSDGKIGIGEDDPDGNKLLIRHSSTVGTNKGHIMLTGDGATNGEGPQIVFSESGSGSSYAGAYVGHIREGGNSQGSLVFGTRNTSGDASTVPAERIRIYSTGQILYSAASGDNQITSKRTNTAGSDGNYFFHLKAQASGGTNVGALGFHRDTNTDDSRLVFFTKKTGGSEANAERLRITSTGAVTISGNRNQVAPTAYNDLTGTNQAGLIIGSSGITDAGIMLRTGTSGTGRIYFGDNSGSDAGRKQGQINYYHNGDFMMFATANAERVRITSGGNVNIGGDYTQTSYKAQITGDLLLQKSQAAYQHPQIELYATSNTAHGGAIKFSGKHGGSKYEQVVLKAYGGTGANTGSFVIATGNGTDKMRIQSDGSIEFRNQTLANIRVDDGNSTSGSGLKITIDNTEHFRFEPGHFEFKEASNTSKATFMGGINYWSNTNAYIDLTQWTLGTNWNHLEVFGYVNPNGAGSGQYTDPVHMYIYRGVGWANGGIKNFIYSVHVAPPARQAFPGGSGMSGNSGISAVWYHPSSGIVGNESATSTHYIRLVIPNANTSSNFQKTFRILRRF